MVSVRKKARICHSPRRHERLSLSVLLVVVRIKGSFNYVSNGQSHPAFNPLVAIVFKCVCFAVARDNNTIKRTITVQQALLSLQHFAHRDQKSPARGGGELANVLEVKRDRK